METSVTGRRFGEAAIIPDKRVLEFTCDRSYAVDVLVIAVKKVSKEIWWLVNSCSPSTSGGERIVLQQKVELEMPQQWYCLGSRDIREVVYRSHVLQDVGAAGHSCQLGRISIHAHEANKMKRWRESDGFTPVYPCRFR